MAETPVETPPAKETPTPPAKDPAEKNVDTPAPAEKPEGEKPADAPAEPEKDPPKDAPDPKGEPKPAEPKAPEKYDLKLPEDSLLDKGVMAEVSDFAKKHGLSNEDAQALLDRRNADVKAHVDGEKERLAQQSEDWKKLSVDDPEIGGDKFDESVEIAKRGLDAVASPEFRKALVDTGLGNHPEVIRVFRRVGNLIGDDKLVDGKPIKQQKSQADRMYGKKEKKEG